jgi:membrane protein DedA with SNARE-associated domain
MGQLILIAFATFASEDLTCIATGALIASGKLGFVPGVLACLAGIFFGDLLLYFAGRLIGRPLVRWKPLRKMLTQQKLDRASQWLADRGAGVVILSRFTPGLRLPTYVAAGLLKTRFWTFAGYFLLAAALWTPILVGATALLGKNLPSIAFLAPAALLVVAPWPKVRRKSRKIRWEFWPPWLAYLPVVPYILYLGVKHRSLTLFTATNPGIPSGGFVGESKSAILSHLPCVPGFTVIPAGATFIVPDDMTYPVVLKPDVGERGTGVVIARNQQEVTQYLKAATIDTILQQYVPGLEFGIFYYRYPSQTRGSIFSITEKHFPEVTGDGRSTITDLILQDHRAACIADVYMARLKDRIPAKGERVRLVELGSHCRGAIFLDGARLETPQLAEAIDAAAKSHPGFYLGRFDVRTPSITTLQSGQFQILELNGVSAEATHIYDPAISVKEAYRVMLRQWKIAFEIAAENRKSGAVPTPLDDFLRLAWSQALNPEKYLGQRRIPQKIENATA